MTLKKEDRLSALDLAILPSIFARSNMGQGLPDQQTVDRLKRGWQQGGRTMHVDLHSAVISVCQEFMECDEHERMFVAEARGWVKTLRADGKARICEVHSDIATLYWGAEDPVVMAGRARSDAERARQRRRYESRNARKRVTA